MYAIRSYYAGNYSGYREWKREQERLAAEELKTQLKKSETGAVRQVRQVSKPTWAEKKEYEQLTVDIARLEKRKQELSEWMNNGTGSPDELTEWSMIYGEITADRITSYNVCYTKLLRWLSAVLR